MDFARPAVLLLSACLGLGLRAAPATSDAEIHWRAPAELFRAAGCDGRVVSDLPGAPALPETVLRFDVPRGQAVSGLTCVAEGWHAAEDAEAPGVVPAPWRPGLPASARTPDAEIWGRAVWPERPAEILREYAVGGVRKVAVRVRPRRWRGTDWRTSGTGLVEVPTNLQITVSFTNAPMSRPSARLQSAADAPDLVILAPPDLHAAWTQYAARRRTVRPDLALAVVPTDEIYARHPFGADLPCRNAAESVHAFIREQAQAGVGSFLLGGMWLDAREPTPDLWFRSGERLSLSNCVPGVCVRPYHGDYGAEIPSDMFFACLDDVGNGLAHPWDPDGDGEYLGEDESDRCDCVPDVVVARFAALPFAYGDGAVATPARLVTDYAEKVARGEAEAFPGVRRLGLASARQVGAYPRGTVLLSQTRRDIAFLDDVDNLWGPVPADEVADAELVQRDILASVLAAGWPVDAVESLHATGRHHARRHADFPAAQTAWFATDMLFASCRAHGSASGTAQDGRFWISRDLYARARGLTLFADYGVPCETGRLQLRQTVEGRLCAEPSLGLAAVCAPQGGVVLGVFNSGYGWSAAFENLSPSDTYSGTLSYETMRTLFLRGEPTFARAHLRARQDYASTYAMRGVRLYALCEQMLYGDPTVRLPDIPRDAVLDATGGTFVSASCPADAPDVREPLRVMETLACAAPGLTLSVSGGVGRALAFTGAEPGTLALNGSAPFHVGGLSNCVAVTLTGAGKTLDLSAVVAPPSRLAVAADSAAADTNILRCVRTGRLAEVASIPVTRCTLSLETAEALGTGPEPLAAVTNGVLLLAPSPLWGRSGTREHLARPVRLADSALRVDGAGVFLLGRSSESDVHPFDLHVSGASSVAPATDAGAVVGLEGPVRIHLRDGAELVWSLATTNAARGGVSLDGDGVVRAASSTALVGAVEVGAGAVLELAETPLAGATSLVVRAGAVVRVPSAASGFHPLVAPGGRLVLEAGAAVQDLAGRPLAGLAADHAFFETSSALRWKGGAGSWSDADGWYDYESGRTGGWIDGHAAVFDADGPSVVSNDLAGVRVAGFVFASDTALAGASVSCGSPFLTVPRAVSVSVGLPLGCGTGLEKHGAGGLVLSGDQAGLLGGLRVVEGRLLLDGVRAEGVTNLAAAAGSELALRGASFLTNAAARASLATNALVSASPGAPASLALGTFAPVYRQHVPSDVTLTVSAGGLSGSRWTATLDGRVACRDVLALNYGILEGAGTLRVPGLMSRCYTSAATIRNCRVELVPDATGRVPVWGKGLYSSHYGYFAFDGATLAPVEGDVLVTGLGFEKARAVLYVDKGGLAFDMSDPSAGGTAGRNLVLGEAGSDILFGGPGDVTKTGPGTVRFTSVVDQHRGLTVVAGGTYAVASWTLSSGFDVRGPGCVLALAVPDCEGALRLGAGGVLDLSAHEPTTFFCTNLYAEAGAEIRLALSEDGADVLDAREGPLVLPATGRVRLRVSAAPRTPAGVYPLLLADDLSDAAFAALDVEVAVPPGARARVFRTPDRAAVAVDYRAPGTMLLLR